jgi:hypothetical protein
MEGRMGVMTHECKGLTEKIPSESQYHGRELTVAIAVWKMQLNKTLVCPSCMRTKVKTAVRSTPALNWATQRLDKTDLCSPARDDAEWITVTGIMVNVSKLHVGTSYGIKNRGYYNKMWSKLGKEAYLGWIGKAPQIIKLSRVPGQQVQIHLQVSRDSAWVVKWVVKYTVAVQDVQSYLTLFARPPYQHNVKYDECP